MEGGEAVIVKVLLEPEAMSPRSVGLTLSQVGPDTLLTVTPLTMLSLAETVTISLSDSLQFNVGLQLVEFTPMLPQGHDTTFTMTVNFPLPSFELMEISHV